MGRSRQTHVSCHGETEANQKTAREYLVPPQETVQSSDKECGQGTLEKGLGWQQKLIRCLHRKQGYREDG